MYTWSFFIATSSRPKSGPPKCSTEVPGKSLEFSGKSRLVKYYNLARVMFEHLSTLSTDGKNHTWFRFWFINTSPGVSSTLVTILNVIFYGDHIAKPNFWGKYFVTSSLYLQQIQVRLKSFAGLWWRGMFWVDGAWRVSQQVEATAWRLD